MGYDSLKDQAESSADPSKRKLPSTSTTIDGQVYSIVLLPTSDGIRMSKELLQLLLPSVGSVADGIKEDLAFGGATTFTDAAVFFISQLDNVDVLNIIKALTQGLKVDDVPVTFDDHFKGNYGNLLACVKFALEANFSSFFQSADMKRILTDFFKLLAKTEETEDPQPTQQ